MNKVIFFVIAVLLISFQYIADASFLNIFTKPWHMQPFANEDSLSVSITQQYRILDKKKVYPHFEDSARTVVNILVDAWGVPLDDSFLEEDFEIFKNTPHQTAIHQRLLNQTMHAERVEFRNEILNSIYLFGGDSLEYNRKEYIPQLGFATTDFCQNCPDKVMIGKVDSLLSVADSLPKVPFIALTTQSSRSGDRDSLRATLVLVADLIGKHPEVTFIVQGTHRPILGTPTTRRKYYAHWVPVVIANRD